MSLVEEALRKMQLARRSTDAAADASQSSRRAKNAGGSRGEGVFGTVVSTGVHKVLEADSAPLTQPPEPLNDRLVQIDQAALRVAGLLPPEHQARQLAQQYRQIKRPLLVNATGRGGPKLPSGHLIMMASAVPGEGKTFTSLNLAFSMALEKDIRLLLVDADVPKPHISKLLGVDKEPGLLDALKDPTIDVETLILPTNVPNLLVLPAGRRSEHATELLASKRMEEITRRMNARDPNRIVLFDSPPLLLTTESQALAQLMGQIVIVVRADFTPQQRVMDALSYVDQKKHVALVLNQSVNVSPTSYYYGYGDQRDDETDQ